MTGRLLGIFATVLTGCTLVSGAADLRADRPAEVVADGGGGARAELGPPDSGVVEADATADAQAPCTPIGYGPSYATDVDPGAGWEQPQKARVKDGDPAESEGTSSPIVLSGFHLGVPTNAIIRGIQVAITRGAEGEIHDEAIALVKGSPQEHAEAWEPAIGFPFSSFPTETYGSAVDLWGASWTASDVNADGFSVSVSASETGNALLDGVAVTVFACP